MFDLLNIVVVWMGLCLPTNVRVQLWISYVDTCRFCKQVEQSSDCFTLEEQATRPILSWCFINAHCHRLFKDHVYVTLDITCHIEFNLEQDSQCTCNIISRGVRVIILAVKKHNFFLILWVCCIRALIARDANRVILSSVACLAVPHFPSFSHKLHDIRKKTLLDIRMCLILFTTNVWNISLCKKNSAICIIINVHTSSCKVPVILRVFWWTWILSTDI